MKKIFDVELFTMKEVASQLGVAYLTVERVIARNDLQAVRIGHELFISKENLVSYLNGFNKNHKSKQQEKASQKHVVAIKYKCHTCKKAIDPKEDIYHYFESGKVEPLRFCSKQHLDDMRRKPGKKVKNEVA